MTNLVFRSLRGFVGRGLGAETIQLLQQSCDLVIEPDTACVDLGHIGIKRGSNMRKAFLYLRRKDLGQRTNREQQNHIGKATEEPAA